MNVHGVTAPVWPSNIETRLGQFLSFSQAFSISQGSWQTNTLEDASSRWLLIAYFRQGTMQAIRLRMMKTGDLHGLGDPSGQFSCSKRSSCLECDWHWQIRVEHTQFCSHSRKPRAGDSNHTTRRSRGSKVEALQTDWETEADIEARMPEQRWHLGHKLLSIRKVWRLPVCNVA